MVPFESYLREIVYVVDNSLLLMILDPDSPPFTIIDTVAGLLSAIPSFTLYVKLSCPLKPGFGV
jgi:hypothetical protein